MEKLLKILPKNEKKSLILFFFLILIIMLLECLSIGAVFPLLITILSENFKTEKAYLLINNYIGDITYNYLILLLLSTLSLIFIIKNLFIIYLKWWSNGFNNRVQFKLQRRLLEIYLSQLYLDVLEKNSAIKVRNITQEISKFSKYFMSLMVVIIETMVVMGIGFLLFFLNPTIAISMSIIISFLILFFYFIAKIKAVEWSKKKLKHGAHSTKFLIESLSALKELRIFKKEKLFLDKYANEEKAYLHLSRLFSTFNESPRILLESVMVIALSVSIILMINLGVEKKEILATLGIFGVAGFRLFPSTTRIIRSINDIKNFMPSIDLILNELNLGKNILKEVNYDESKVEFNNLIEFKNVHYCYPGKEKKIIQNFNFQIRKGNKIGLFGESGSGKSTLLNLIIGYLNPTNGEIEIDNQKVFDNYNQLRNIFSYVSQDTFLLDESIKYNITFNNQVNEEMEKKLNDIIEVVNLKNFVSNLDKGLNTIVGEKGLNISGGQRQRISIARAIFNSKEILILDEPTNELDEANEYEIINKIFERFNDKTIILTTHNKELLDFCDATLFFKEGKILQNIKNEKNF